MTTDSQDQLDEAGNIIQRGLGKVAGALGAVAGVPAGMARAFKAGKAQGAEAVGGADTAPATQDASAASAATNTGQTPVDANSIKQQIAQKKAEITTLEKQLTTAQSSTGTEPAEKSIGDKVGDYARGVGNNAAGAIKTATDALNAGNGMGTAGRSLAQDYSSDKQTSKNDVKIKDAQGQEHSYKKVGQQWFDDENKPVNAAQSAMLDKQAEQQAAMSKASPQGKIPGAKPPAATKQEPMKLGGETLDPNDPASAKVIAQIQKQQGAATAAEAPATQGTPDPRDLNKDGTVDATEKSIARNKTKTAGQAAPVPQSTADQSPEEIRKAKQAAATTVAQDQMAANPAPAQQPAAVWKNNRAPEGTPAGTSPADAAAKANTGNDVMARMAKQLAPAPAATPAATPNFGQQPAGYASVKTNATTGVPQVGGPQPTAGAKAVPVQQPAAAPTASAQADANKPGFLQSKIKGSQVPAKQPEMAGTDFSAMLARKAKIKL